MLRYKNGYIYAFDGLCRHDQSCNVAGLPVGDVASVPQTREGPGNITIWNLLQQTENRIVTGIIIKLQEIILES
jgi:hypothetical protein